MSATYTEFKWLTEGAANGAAGVGLTRRFVKLISGLEHVERICELGCGNGYLAGQLASSGYHVTGLDASESGIEMARRLHPTPNFVCSNIDRALALIGSQKFDLVISSDVLEHLYRPASLLETASALVKPQGQILIGTPYHGYLKNLVLSLTGRMDAHFDALDDGGHIKFFSVRTLSDLMARHGFVNLNFHYYGRGPWLWMNMICHARRADS
jgi:SAM-dependent methyltransferase